MNLFAEIFFLLSIVDQDTALRYIYNPVKMDYPAARDYCRSKQMEIVKISNFNVDSCVYNFANERKLKSYWINGNDIFRERYWLDSNENTLPYTNWKTGEPNDVGKQNCINAVVHLDGLWDDISCDSENSVICEKPEYEYMSTNMTFANAVDFCRSNGMELVTIPDKETNMAVYNFARQNHLERYWINGNDRVKEGRWVDTNNEPLLYRNWYPGEPNDYKNEDCLQGGLYSNGLWNDIFCKSKSAVICEIPEFFHSEKKLKYKHAVNLCKEKGMQLLKIRDKETDIAVFNFAKENNFGKYWINGNDKNGKGYWVDTNKAPLVYTNWKNGHPINNSIENCIRIGLHPDGMWNNIPCNEKNTVICEKPEFVYTTTRMTFNAAIHFSTCRGMELVKIPDKKTNMAVYNFAKEKKLDRYWMNGNDNDKEGRWVTTNNIKLSYTNWKGGEPNNFGTENCLVGAFYPFGLWNDISCNNQNAVICSWKDFCNN